MADVEETTTYTDAAQAVSQGKRHLLVRDYSMAVTALAQGCSLLAEQYGDMADELGEPLLLYGRALLGLTREESGVLGTVVPEDGEDVDEDEEEVEAVEEEDATEKGKEDGKDEAKSTAENVEEKANGEKKSEEKPVVSESSTSAKNEAGSSENGEKVTTNGEASTSTTQQNGIAHENGEEDAEDVENEEEDEANNLQLAWEILELAKLILTKRGDTGLKLLAETHRLLGELAMEGGNEEGAKVDLQACLDLLSKLEPADARSMAETRYQLGLAYSLGNDFDASIAQFQEALSLLESRVKELESMTDAPRTDDPFYTIEGEIKELKELLPDIQEKITDMRDFKQQACKAIIDKIKNTVAGGSCSNGAGPSGESSTSPTSSKPASDISHLVRKKRKTEEEELENPSPCKKPLSEKSA